jgi:hypothetical protein
VDVDEKIFTILNHGAPPRHDPMFRLRVLERFERKQFQHRLIKLLLATAAVALIVLAYVGASTELSERTGELLLCLAIAISSLVHAPVVAHFGRKVWTRGAFYAKS